MAGGPDRTRSLRRAASPRPRIALSATDGAGDQPGHRGPAQPRDGHDPVDAPRRLPGPLAVLEHVGAGRPGGEQDPAAVPLLAAVVLAVTAATRPADGGRRDHRHA